MRTTAYILMNVRRTTQKETMTTKPTYTHTDQVRGLKRLAIATGTLGILLGIGLSGIINDAANRWENDPTALPYCQPLTQE